MGVITVASGMFSDIAGNLNEEGGALSPPLEVDTVILPEIVRFSSTSPDGTYKIGQSIQITALLSEPVRSGGTVSVSLSSGGSVTLVLIGGQTLAGTYVVQPGEIATDLDVTGIVSHAGLVDLAGNPVRPITPPIGNGLASSHNLAVDGAIKILPITGLSTNPNVVPNIGKELSSIAVTFTTPVTGLTVSSFRLYLNGRSVSLRGARVVGAGDTYNLLLPPRRTRPRGIYTLEIVADGAIRSPINGAAMTETASFYWGRDRSIGLNRRQMLRAFATLR
jgi:hypothetical protein